MPGARQVLEPPLNGQRVRAQRPVEEDLARHDKMVVEERHVGGFPNDALFVSDGDPAGERPVRLLVHDFEGKFPFLDRKSRRKQAENQNENEDEKTGKFHVPETP